MIYYTNNRILNGTMLLGLSIHCKGGGSKVTYTTKRFIYKYSI